jgi:mutator protein MutT
MQRVPCAAVIVENPKGEVLLNLRDSNPDIAFPDCWTLPGGRVESDETPEQAAIRELREETGLQLCLSFWKVYERHYPEEKLVVEQHVFVGKTDHKHPRLVLGEGQALQFFGIGRVSSLPIAFEFETLLEEFFTCGRQTHEDNRR